MNITVTVAIITSLSTLAGGIIGSMTTLKVQNKQIKQQNEAVNVQRIDEHRAERRRLRRDAYVALLDKFDDAISQLDACWQDRPASEPDAPVSHERLEAGRAIVSLVNALNVVQLEGPQSVADAADRLREILHREVIEIYRLAAANTGSTQLLFEFGSKFGESVKKRSIARQVLLNCARAALEEVAP